MSLKVILLICATVLLTEIECSRILVVYPCPSKSHLVNGKVLFKALAERGHNVTVISNFPLEKPMENYRDIYIPISKEISDMMTSFMDTEKTSKLKMFMTSHTLSTLLTSSTLENKEVRQMMNEESFDLVIFGYVMNEVLLGMGAHFNCPQIILFANAHIPSLNSLVGNPAGTSYVPNMMLSHKGVMDFRKRLINSAFYVFGELMTKFVNYNNKRLYDIYFPSEKYPTFEETLKNVSLIFVTTHFSVGSVRPNQPNIIEIGGIQAKLTPSPLPEDIKDWLDSAEDGAIYMSLGTNLKSSDLSQEKLQAIMTVFGKLKQKILWKWETDTLEGKPDNVKIGKWLPQDDILAHPNVKLFITHGGLGGLTEAKFHGVPILGIPFFADQPMNLNVAKQEGWAVILEKENITETYFSQGINEALNNRTYANKVKEISNLFRDRPLQPLDTAVYWTEYVIRHRGAKHLQSNAVHLNFFQLHLIDVWALLVGLIYIGFKVNLFLIKFVWGKLFSKGGKSDVKLKIK